MLFWAGESEHARINKPTQTIVVQGISLEAKVEEKGLRLSKVELVSNKDEQHCEAVLNLENELKHRREDLEAVKKEIREIKTRLDATEDEDEEEELFLEYRQKKAIKKQHEKVIKQLEAQTTVSVHYQVGKEGVSVLMPAGMLLRPKFLSKPVCWCPDNMPACQVVKAIEDKCEEMPLSMTSADHTTATGTGLEQCSPDTEAKFTIVAKDSEGQPRDTGGDTFVVESAQAEVKSSLVDNDNGTYDVSYVLSEEVKEDKFPLSVSLRGCPIRGSPFDVSVYALSTAQFAVCPASRVSNYSSYRISTLQDCKLHLANYYAQHQHIQLLEQFTPSNIFMIKEGFFRCGPVVSYIRHHPNNYANTMTGTDITIYFHTGGTKWPTDRRQLEQILSTASVDGDVSYCKGQVPVLLFRP